MRNKEKLLLNDFAIKIVEKKMSVPAIFFLESTKYLSFIGSQILIFFRLLVYFQTFHLPVRYLIYVGITALARVLLEYVNEWHEKDLAEIPYEILVICGGILLLTLSILILRYSSKKFPSSS